MGEYGARQSLLRIPDTLFGNCLLHRLAIEPVTAEGMSTEDEDTMSYFAKLAKED